MFAIVEIAGLQYKVGQDQKLYVNRLAGEVGDTVSFTNVLMTVNGSISIGAPAVEGITVDAEILTHLKGDKVIVFKKKRRKGYQKKNGHRQYLTQIRITGITGFPAVEKSEKRLSENSDKASVTPDTNSGADSETVNFSEDHELNYNLKKHGLSASKDNREKLVSLGSEYRDSSGKSELTHADVANLIQENISEFKVKS